MVGGERPSWAQSRLARGQCSVSDFTEHVELELLARLVTDPDRLRALVAGKPVELHFREPALATDGVHDLELARVACDRTLQPVLPGRSLFRVATQQQR